MASFPTEVICTLEFATGDTIRAKALAVSMQQSVQQVTSQGDPFHQLIACGPREMRLELQLVGEPLFTTEVTQ